MLGFTSACTDTKNHISIAKTIMKIRFISLSWRPFWFLSLSYFCSAAIWVNFIFLKITYNNELKSIKKPFEVILLNFNVLFTGLEDGSCFAPNK